jgi:acyl-coenzyme A synthetase/AMP-(fatty) acid ligase
MSVLQSSQGLLARSPGGRNRSGNFISGFKASAAFEDLAQGTIIKGGPETFRDRSVLIATKDHFTAALAILELDGVARRLVLCPPDLPPHHLSFVINSAEADSIVLDDGAPEFDVSAGMLAAGCLSRSEPFRYQRDAHGQTEWILLTSGTTGRPKLVAHTLSGLAGAINRSPSNGVVWSTFYDVRRYGGLQILLRAVLTGASLVLSDARESTGDFLVRAGSIGVTHISGTPSHWRSALMNPSARMIGPRYVRLSGEIADQAILDDLKATYPDAQISHAFASTEGGVAFEVTDGLAGFPATALRETPDVEMKIEQGSLRIRSARTAERYLGNGAESLRDSEGFVDTGDIVELRNDRYYFAGRRDGVINVGGLKVYPEEVEAVINSHPSVGMSLVRGRRNSVSGALVAAEVVLKTDAREETQDELSLQNQILLVCREALQRHKVPATIRFVPSLAVNETGKLVRAHA